MENQNEDYLKDLELEVAEELANVQFYESNAFPAFERSLTNDIKKFQDVLFNEGKPSMGDVAHIRDNEARVEIAVRKSFLERFQNSVPRYKRAVEELSTAQKEKS